MITIRKEERRDFNQVYVLNTAAFGGEDESRLVEKLRGVEGCISLVAVENDLNVIGHISFSPVTLDDKQTSYTGLAPMSVLPDRQRQGIGSELITAGLKACRETGHIAVFVLGHSDYYPRFGFRAAADFRFSCEYPVPPENFMALELVEGSLAGKAGLIKYHPAFAGV